MCTVTWVAAGDGYELFCNRDEHRGRGRAGAPRRFDEAGVAFLAPVDPDAGGTWVAVNELGVSFSLLNAHPPAWTPGEKIRSRGEVIMSLAMSPSARLAAGALGGRDLGPYRPFTLVILDPTGAVPVFDWDGEALSRRASDDVPILSSSSGGGVVVSRRDAFRKVLSASPRPASEEILEFHRGHEPEKGSSSVCMHHHEGATVSLSWIKVGGGEVVFRYSDGRPCRTPLGEPRTLALRAPAGG